MTINKTKLVSYVALVGVIIAPLFSFLNLGKVNAAANSYQVSVSADKPVANRGDTINYTLSVTNDGTSILNDILITDTLPDNVTYKAGSTVLHKDNKDILVTDAWRMRADKWENVGKLVPGQGLTFTFAATVNDTAVDGERLRNKGGFKCAELPNWTEKDAYVTVEVSSAKASMQYGIQVDKTTASRGDVLRYTAQVKNTGSAALTDLNVYDYLPNYATYKLGTTSYIKGEQRFPVNDGWLKNEMGINLGELPVGATVTLYFDLTVNNDAPNGGEIKNTMFFKSIELPNEDYCLARTIVTVPSETSLSIDKKVKKENGDWLDSIDKGAHGHVFSVGEKVFYQIVVTNNGDEGVDNVKIVDTLPEYIQVNDNVTVVTMVGRLEPKESKTYEFEAVVKDAPSGERKQENVAKVMTGDDEKGRDLAFVWIAGGSKGEVLGEPTKLPEAGAETGIISLVTSFGLSVAGLILRKKSNSLI